MVAVGMSASEVIAKLAEFSHAAKLNRDLLLALLTRHSRRNNTIATTTTVSVQEVIDKFGENSDTQVKVSGIYLFQDI